MVLFLEPKLPDGRLYPDTITPEHPYRDICREHKVVLRRWDEKFCVWRCPVFNCPAFVRQI